MKTHIVLLSLGALCLTLNPPVLATNRLVPSQCLTQEAFPISLNYDAEAYAYADRDETETDIGFSTNGKAQAQAHAHFEHREPSTPCFGDIWWIEDSYADNSVEGVSGVEGAWLISTLKGWGEYSGGDECTGYTYGGTGSGVGGGCTLLAGTIGIDADYTMKVEAAVDGSSPGSWESWDWWFKIWDDDANNPIVVLNDSNMSVNLEVLAGQILNVELYHEGGTRSWPENGLESTLKVGLIVGPIMGVSGTEFLFNAQVGGSSPEPQTLSISNIGAGTLNWEITEGCSWLSAEPNSGSSTVEANEVAVIVDISGLATGLYNCELTVSGEGATGSPQIIEVTLFVRGSYLNVPGEFGTIQEAIDVAVNGETVLVAPGTYTGADNKNLDFGGKAITVRSINPEDPCVVAATVIDCQNSGRGFNFHSGEEANSVLAGFTIKRGRVLGNPAMGGGIYCCGSSPTIKNCIIRNNRANGNAGGWEDNGCHGYGGGIYCASGSRPTVVGCMITENAAVGGHGGIAGEPVPLGWPGMGGHAFGGGIFGSGLAIEECVINNNNALGGAGGHDLGDPSYDGAGGDGHGGGIYGSVTISNSIVSGNAARAGVGGSGSLVEDGEAYGGGLYGGSTINNCLIFDNVADDRVDSSSYVLNAGGGVYGGAVLANCTISGNVVVDNIGGVAGAATIVNCILWGNGDDLGGCSATYSCIEDDDAGEGNIHDNPRFVTGPLGNYYLSQVAAGQAVDSPCVDAGSDMASNLGMDKFTTRTDELKDTSIVDMGYHYFSSFGSPDIDGDCDVDFYDYAWLAMGRRLKYILRGSVVVDGDLSDWPEDVEWRELDKVYWGNPNDVIESRFALQWDDATDKVYVAVVVNDTDHLFLDEYVTWDASDRIEVYSQGDAEGGIGWNGIYDAAQQYYVAPDTFGGSWATWAEGETLGTDVGLEYAVDVNGAQIIYEVGVRQFDNYGGFSGGETVLTDLYAGHFVGFDIVANTRWDTVNFGMLSENLIMGKYQDAGKFAKYILVEKTSPTDLDGNGVFNYADTRILFESWLDCYTTKATNPVPANDSIDAYLDVMLSWEPGDGAFYHDVYFGTDANAVANAGPLSPEFMGTVSEAHFDPCGLDLATTYYWRIDEAGQMCLKQGDVWSFQTWLYCYIPKASNPVPANDAIDEDPNVMLNWVPGEGALWHDVYFGTDADAVANAGQLSPEFMGTISEAHFDPCDLDLATTYYWRIDEVGSGCLKQGDIWNFTIYEHNLHPVGRWKFDEGEGSIAYDSASDNDGTIYGANWTSGKINGALSFDGMDDYVDIGDTIKDYLVTSYTVSAWIKTNTISSNNVISSYRHTTDINPVLFQLDHYNEDIRFTVRDNSSNTLQAYYPYGFTTNAWYHIAGVREGNMVNIYVNGISGISSSYTLGAITPNNLKIGATQTGGNPISNYFSGTIDDVMIFDRALSASEIEWLYENVLSD